MQDNSALLIAVAGFAVVCAGTLFIALLIVLRVTGRSAMSFLSLLIRGANGDPEEEGPVYVQPARPDLRQIAESVDFEAAVAKNVVEQREFGTGSTPALSDTPPPPNADKLPPGATPRLERAKRLGRDEVPRRRRRDYSDDEIFGGILDVDGDNYPDS